MTHKKIILALGTFALAAGAYFALSAGDRRRTVPAEGDLSEAVRDFVTLPTSQPSHSIGDAEMRFRPGERTLARIYDDVTGRLKYQFEAKKWEPLSETDFHVEELLIQIYTPRGEITYISADTAEVTIARKARNRLEPKRGWLRGNVRVVIDRTTSEWREAHPDLADRYAHADDLINIDLDDASFDLDQAELRSEGTIVVDSREARIDRVEGLTLQWNQVDNRIDVLRFAHGGRMILRRGGRMVDFALPGTERGAQTSDQPDGSAPEQDRDRRARFEVPRAQAMKPMSIGAVTADEAAAEIRLEGGIATANRPKSLEPEAHDAFARPSPPGQLRSPAALAGDVDALKAEARAGAAGEPLPLDGSSLEDPREPKRIHTYRAVLLNDVLVEQKDGLLTRGRLKADRLEINFDFGKKLRSLAGPRGGKRVSAAPDDAEAALPDTLEPPEPDADSASSLDEDRTKLILTWDGPLELRPLRVEPAEQTGQRFDVIATGRPVVVETGQAADQDARRATATCGQLVYRHERRQVWLAGTEAEPVEITVDQTRRLVGREVFFDQKRGLARVDGPGYMFDERRDTNDATAPNLVAQTSDLVSPTDAESPRKDRDPVEIRWSRGVDVELGHRTVLRQDPSTGLMQEKRREFLQRAWFHGEVSVTQGASRLSADEVAATFGLPISGEAMADHLQHLNMSGNVRLVRDDDLISADRLDVEMIVTPDGRNVPRVVDGSGNVLVRQERSEFRAQQMHVVLALSRRDVDTTPDALTPALDRSRLGIASLDASGDVFVSDPERNLKVRNAETLSCVMRHGNQLVTATIVGAEPDALARARYEEVAVHGHRIEIDMDQQSIEVPGPGKTWMVTSKDFGGSKLSRPTTVKTTWTGNMEFRLAEDYGRFVGNVHSRSVDNPEVEGPRRAFSLTCDKMTVRFGRVPPVREKQGDDLVERLWLLGRIIGDKAEVTSVLATDRLRESRRPTYVLAEGHAEALSVYHASSASDAPLGPLLSRVQIAGDRIVADLLREQMSVPCAGTLLIEDYQFDAGGSKPRLARTPLADDPLMSSVRNEGPSQTMVRWESSMDFFVDRNLVAFDKGVWMVHLSGRELAMQEQLAAAMNMDAGALHRLGPGRKATLTCGYLLLEFLTGAGPDLEAGPAVRATDLKRLIAKHAVHLQEGSKSLMGTHMQYLHETNEVRIEGNDMLEARIIDQDESSQRISMWRGPLLIWNRGTNRIEAPHATIRTSRR